MSWFSDHGWLAWVGLALVLGAVEAATVDFVFLMLALVMFLTRRIDWSGARVPEPV